MVDWIAGIRGVLAFFPVVAISSNFSTIFWGAKKAYYSEKNKRKGVSKMNWRRGELEKGRKGEKEKGRKGERDKGRD